MQLTVDGQTYIDGPEVARRANVTCSTVCGWAKRGTLPSYRWGMSRRLWFREDEVAKLLTMHPVPAAKTRPQQRSQREQQIATKIAQDKVRAWCNGPIRSFGE